MKAKSSVPEKGKRLESPEVEPSLQPATQVNEELVPVNQFINDLPETVEELRQLNYKLGDILAGTVLISEMLIAHSDDKLEIKNEAGEKVVYSSVGMASGEALEIYVTKLFAAYNTLDGIVMGLDHRLDAMVPKKNGAAAQSAA